MSKRFTDTAKWDQAWFRKLSPEMKCVWSFLCDRCDHAGVWEIDIESMSFFIGKEITMHDIQNVFGDKIEVFSETKILIQAFVDFQYGALNPDNRVHQSVISRLEKLGPYKPLKSPLKGAKDKDKDKEKEKELDKEKEKEKEDVQIFFEFWNSLPFKVTKALKLTAERREKIKSRLKEVGLDEWKITMLKIQEYPFLLGEGSNSRGWSIDLDWLIANEGNRISILEGKYKSLSNVRPIQKNSPQAIQDGLQSQYDRIIAGEL